MSLSMEVGIACFLSPGNEALSMEGSMELRDNAVYLFQPFHCAVVLKYFWLKEEMTKSTAMSVADGLYSAQKGRNGLMSAPHYERIKECYRRREKVDFLLQHILRGTKETYICFVQLLTKSGDEHIAKSLDENSPTDAQFQEFVRLQLSSLGNVPRPDYHLTRFTLQEGEFQRLRFILNDVTTIEAIADFLLSNLFFSISEHKNISSCPLKDEQRIASLLHTMEKCSNKICQPLKEVLGILKMEYVLSDLLEIRRDPADKDMLEDNDLPNMLLDDRAERNVLKAFQADPMKLNMKTFKAFSFEVEGMEIGSIVIRLRPVFKDSWQRFREQCSSGEIKNFIASVYENENLEEGRYEIDVKIYQVFNWRNNKGHCAIIHLKEKNETETKGGRQDMGLESLEQRLKLEVPMTAIWGEQEKAFSVKEEGRQVMSPESLEQKVSITAILREQEKAFSVKEEEGQNISWKSLEQRLNRKTPQTTIWRKQKKAFSVKQKAGTLIRKENYIVRHMHLLCEEMDVSPSLLSYLSQHELLNDFIKEELKKKTGRAEKMRFLLTVLSDKENAEERLKQFIKKTDSCLFDKIESKENETNPEKEEETVDESRYTRYQRSKIVYKLLTSERAYVARLHLLNVAYHLRVTSENMNDNFMPPEVVTQIFSHIHSIYELHHDSVLPQLETRMENWSQEDRIADIFLSTVPFLELYRGYVKNFVNVIDLIAEWTNKSPKFASLLQEIQKPTNCGQLTLQQRLFELKRRVSVYELHLKEYLEYLDIESAEMTKVEKVLMRLKEAGEYTDYPLLRPNYDPFTPMMEYKPGITRWRTRSDDTGRRLYFTAVAILMVKRNDSSRGKTVKDNSSAISDMQLWCQELVNPVCYFEGKLNTKDDFPEKMKPRPTSPETGRQELF